MAEHLLSHHTGSIIALDPRNGQVLALASNPAFDPNTFTTHLSSAAWTRLATDLPLNKLDAMTQIRPMADVPAITADILKGQVRGRTVIDVNA